MKSSQMFKHLPVSTTLTLHSLAVALRTARFNIKNSPFCQPTVLMWFIRISEEADIIYQSIINCFVFTAKYELNFKQKLD
jgi:hypothetical protein